LAFIAPDPRRFEVDLTVNPEMLGRCRQPELRAA